MNLEKLKFSTCPNCKKHGLPAFMKIGRRRNYILTCKYCGKKYQVNIALSIFFKISTAIGIAGLAVLIWSEIPLWIPTVIWVCLFLVFEYYAPIEEYDDKG